jgi:Protein of unknown function (DUF1769)
MTLGPSELSSVVVIASRSPSEDANFILRAFAHPNQVDDAAAAGDDPRSEGLVEIIGLNNGSSDGEADTYCGAGALFEQEDEDDDDEDGSSLHPSLLLSQGHDSLRASNARPVTLISRRLSVSVHLVPTAASASSPAAAAAPSHAALVPSASGSVAVWLYQDDDPLVRGALQRVLSNQNNQQQQPLQADMRQQRIRVRELPDMQGGAGIVMMMMMMCLALPSGSALVVAPRVLVSTRKGRALLNQFLVEREDSAVAVERSVVPSALAPPVPAPLPPQPPPDPDPRVLFPTLRVQLLHSKDEWVPFPVNSPVGQEFETGLFKGRLLVVLRPTDPELDPHWNSRMFSQRKRRILVQLQGQFKLCPKGTVYAGAEVSDPMKLGLLARGLSGVLLRIVEGFNPTVHYAFGTSPSQNGTNDNDDDEEEKAHIVVPAYSFFERVVITPPGQVPPALGSEFEESKESMDRRRNPKEAFQFQFNDRDTYSFSFYSMYMDLPTWQLVNLPIPKGDVSLKTFWRDSLLRICMYERHGNNGSSSLSSSKQPHLVKFNKYAFLLQVSARAHGSDPSCRKLDNAFQLTLFSSRPL